MTTIGLRRIVVGALETNCWVIHAAGSRHTLLVDPGDEPDRIRATVADLDITAVVLTHQHWDHVLGLPEAAASAPVLAHPEEERVWRYERQTLALEGQFDAGTARLPRELLRPTRPLWDGRFEPIGEAIDIGPLRVSVLHTPGHTPGGVSLLLPGHVFTGDTLFPGGPGLTGPHLSDFPTIMRSVETLLRLPDDTVIHPGHGSDTTVGRERPFIREWWQRGW